MLESMTEREMQILETLRQILPKMSSESQNYLLGYGEGIAEVLREQEQAAAGQPVA